MSLLAICCIFFFRLCNLFSYLKKSDRKGDLSVIYQSSFSLHLDVLLFKKVSCLKSQLVRHDRETAVNMSVFLRIEILLYKTENKFLLFLLCHLVSDSIYNFSVYYVSNVCSI